MSQRTSQLPWPLAIFCAAYFDGSFQLIADNRGHVCFTPEGRGPAAPFDHAAALRE
jgi:hypothetical protein